MSRKGRHNFVSRDLFVCIDRLAAVTGRHGRAAFLTTALLSLTVDLAVAPGLKMRTADHS